MCIALAALSCSFPGYRVEELEQAQQPDSPVNAPTCRDGVQNGSEVAIDCGPTCPAACATGNACTADAECETGFCNQAICATPNCADGAKNRTETDLDCGGSDGCAACSTGKRCASAYDCDGGACINGRCNAPSCGDGLQNQDETDVDCGGSSCSACQTKQRCVANRDCAKAQCAQGQCQATGCDDGVVNGDETDVDCGGSCPVCNDFSACKVNADCHSLVCTQARICLAATCSDGVLNGTESSVDCGKACKSQCGLTQTCAVAADCQSGACTDQRCVPKSATNTSLPTTGWVASASATYKQAAAPALAIDGNSSTCWTTGSAQRPGMWFQVDMLSSKAFFSLDLICNSNNDYVRSLRVLLSDDGKTFSAATGTLSGVNMMHVDFGGAKTARFIKIEAEQDTGNLWWRIDELRVLQ